MTQAPTKVKKDGAEWLPLPLWFFQTRTPRPTFQSLVPSILPCLPPSCCLQFSTHRLDPSAHPPNPYCILPLSSPPHCFPLLLVPSYLQCHKAFHLSTLLTLSPSLVSRAVLPHSSSSSTPQKLVRSDELQESMYTTLKDMYTCCRKNLAKLKDL